LVLLVLWPAAAVAGSWPLPINVEALEPILLKHFDGRRYERLAIVRFARHIRPCRACVALIAKFPAANTEPRLQAIGLEGHKLTIDLVIGLVLEANSVRLGVD
jgi:hypothetical protein